MRLTRQPKPHYVHDCEQCVFLGTIEFPARVADANGQRRREDGTCHHQTWRADLYVCLSREDAPGIGRSLVARHASEGSHYSSSPSSIVRDSYMKDEQSTMGPALIACYWFAVAAGHVRHVEKDKEKRYP